MNRKKNKMKKVWKGAAIAALSVLAIGAGATGALRVKADETAAIKQASVTVDNVTTEYATLKEAFDSLSKDSSGYATVTLLTDVAIEEALTTPANERTTVDLNGKKFMDGVFMFYGKDVVTDRSEGGLGYVEKGLAVRSGAVLTVKGGHIYGDYPIYLFENATAIVAGGSFYGHRDALVNEGAELVLKNAEFPAVDGQYGGFDFYNGTSGEKGFADFLDVSAAYYIGDTKADISEIATNDATSVKQQYVATYEQEGQPTVYITDEGAVVNAIFSTGYNVGSQQFNGVDNSLPTKLTLYADVTSISLTQRLENLTIDLNGNVMTDATHRVETTLHLTDSSTYKTGLLDDCTFMLNEYVRADTEVTVTLNCDSRFSRISVYQYGNFAITGGRHYGRFELSTSSDTTNAQVALQGGVYEYLYTRIYKAEDVQFSVKDIATVGDAQNNTWDLYTDETYMLGEALPEGYMLQYADGSFETDLTKQSIYGSFTIVAHEHSYLKHYNGEKHWMECECGLIEAGSEAEHTNSTGILSKDEEAHWYPCDGCGGHISYEGHNFEAVAGTHTDENGYNEHQAACSTCGYEGMVECALDIVDEQPATETAMGYKTYQCACGYRVTETYCDHLGEITYTKVGTDEDTTHEYTCDIEGCGETLTNDCYTEFVDEQPATETAMGYKIYQCACGYTVTEPYCEHLGEITYTKVGTDEDKSHEYTCDIEGCGETLTEDCSFTKGTVYPTITESGYYVYTCDCGYAYNEASDELLAFGDRVLAMIGGLEMTINGNAYYVNGENGEVGTVHSEAPATYHARLTWEADGDGEPMFILEVNGLDISVTSVEALVVGEGVDLKVSGENNIEATYEEYYAAIYMMDENTIVGADENGTLNVTVNGATGVEAVAIYGDMLYVEDVVVNVAFNAVGHAVYVADSLYMGGATLNVSIVNDEGMMRGVLAENLYAEQVEINVEITRSTPKTDEETEQPNVANAIAGYTVEFIESTVYICISDMDNAYALLADQEMEIIESILTVEILGGGGMIIGLAVNEGYDGGLLIEGSTVDITLEKGIYGISVSAQGYASYALKIDSSKVNVEMFGENVITNGISVRYESYENGGTALYVNNSTVTVDTSKAIAQIHHGIYTALDYNDDDEIVDAYSLYVKNSEIYTYYGAGMVAKGIEAQYNSDYYNSVKEAVYVRKSTVYVENQVAGDWDEETLQEYATLENVAIGIGLDFYEARKDRVITLDSSNVTAIAGDGELSAGFNIDVEEESEYDSYLNELLYAIDCKLTFIGGQGMQESAGLRLDAYGYVYGEFGLQLIGCETLAISGEVGCMQMEDDYWYGTTAAMMLRMDTSDELLYLEGGRTVLIAPDTYEGEEDGETVTYNKYSYALIVEGDDAEIVSGTLEMWAGTFCVLGDLDRKNELQPLSSMTYDDEALDNRFGSDIRFEAEMEEDTPKYVFVGENNVYIGGVEISDGEYYVNGKHGEAGKVYEEEPESWNAKLEAVYDEEGDFEKYVLTLNGLYLAAQEDSLLFAQLWSLSDLDIVLMDGSENVVEANVLQEEYAAYRTASATDARTWSVEEVEEDDGTFDVNVAKKGGALTVAGDGKLTLVGSENGWTHDGKLYVAMDSYFENGTYTLKDLENTVDATKDGWTVEAHVHTAGEWMIDKAATCTEAGTKHKACTACGAILETATIEASGHAYGDWKVIIEPTKEEAGLREKVCGNCGDKVSEIIPEKKELSDGAIVGITLGSTVAGCSGIAVGLWFILKKKLLGL